MECSTGFLLVLGHSWCTTYLHYWTPTDRSTWFRLFKRFYPDKRLFWPYGRGSTCHSLFPDRRSCKVFLMKPPPFRRFFVKVMRFLETDASAPPPMPLSLSAALSTRSTALTTGKQHCFSKTTGPCTGNMRLLRKAQGLGSRNPTTHCSGIRTSPWPTSSLTCGLSALLAWPRSGI